MPSIRLTGDIAHIMEGTRAQAADLNLTLAEDGFPVAVTIRKGPLEVLTEAESGAIFCGSRAEFFRGLTMLAARFDERPFRVRETPSLDLLGAMLDCSRNAVPTMEAAKTFLRRLSRMGYNAVLLYTEDTYEVAGRPYFGYLRGRFSQAELRELDQYADALGIEMIPCIQTLGHMARALRWPCMEDMRDTDDVLLLDEEKTYALIEEMIVAASKPFATRRIHIGMDEAYGLGRGKYMDRHGYVPQSELMQKHLARIGDILKKHGLHAMMWSDMYFHMAQPGSTAAYPAGCTLSEAIVAAAPKDIDPRLLGLLHGGRRAGAPPVRRARAVFGGYPLCGRRIHLERPRPRLRQGGSDDARFDDGVPRGGRSAGVRDDVGRRRRGMQPSARRPAGASALCGNRVQRRPGRRRAGRAI